MNVIRKLITIINYKMLKTAFRYNFHFVPNKSKTGLMILMATTIYNKNIIILDEDDQDCPGNNEVDTTKESSLIDSYTKQLKKACDITEDKIKELIKLISKSIEKSSEEYRKRLTNQIEVIKKGMNIDPLSEYWDEVVKHRVEADDLKQEIIKFQSMVTYIGKLILNLQVCKTLLDSVEDKIPEIQREFDILKGISEEQIKLNKKLEQELLKLDTKHILNTPKK